MSTHTAIAITSPGSLEVTHLPTPTPGPDEVLINVHYVGLSPFDEYQCAYGFGLSDSDYPRVIGIVSSGYVKAVGPNVTDLKQGDKVAVFNTPENKNKAAQEFALVPRNLVTKLPESVSLHEAASIPDNYATAFYTLYASANLALPIPTSLLPLSNVTERAPVDLSAPVLVYGAGAASGQFSVQALRVAGYTNIFAVASSRHHEYLRALGATQTFDYRTPDVVSQLRAAIAATAHGRLALAIDVIGARSSATLVSQLFDAHVNGPRAKYAILAPFKDGDTVTNPSDSPMHLTPPPWLTALFSGKADIVPIYTFRIHEDAFSWTNILPVLLPRLLERGEIRPNPIRLLKDGKLLDRFLTALELIRNNKVSGEKVVVEFSVDQ